MQLALRTATGRHPFLGSRYRGFRGLGVTTGYTPEQQAMADAFRSQFGSPPAVYQAPTLIPTPACAFGPTADTSECQAQVSAVNQQNFGLSNTANRDVFVANCLNTVPQPPDCLTRDYGQTPVGGFTSDAIVQGGQLYQNAAGQFVTPPPSAFGISAPPATSSGAGAANFTFTNLTSGNNASFKVGDRWQISITGATPNAPVAVRGGMNGAMATTAMGSTDGSGSFSLNGQMSQDQVGAWTEIWSVGGQDVKSFNFAVVPSGSVVTGGGTGTGTKGSTSTTQTQNFLGSSISIGGTQIPVWGLGLAAVAVFFMFKGGK